MSVPTEQSFEEFTGNGTWVDAAVPFPIHESAELVVTLTLDGSTTAVSQVEGIDYTVEGTIAAPIVRMTVAPPNASTLLVKRTVLIIQDVNLVSQGPFSPATHTRMADHDTFVEQQLKRQADELAARVTVLEVSASPVAGDGLIKTGDTLHVGAGIGLWVTADAVNLDYSGDPATEVIAGSGGTGGSSPTPARDDHQHYAATGVPVEIADGANAEGVAIYLARSDHAHAHGNRAGGTLHAAATVDSAGFMSSADKVQLDALAPYFVIGPALEAGIEPLTIGTVALDHIDFVGDAGVVNIEITLIGHIDHDFEDTGNGSFFIRKSATFRLEALTPGTVSQVGTTSTLVDHSPLSTVDIGFSVAGVVVSIILTPSDEANTFYRVTGVLTKLEFGDEVV